MDKQKSLRSRMLGMEIGDTIEVCVDCYGYTTVRTYAATLGYATMRRYSTHLDRDSRNYQITRTL